MAWCAHVDGSGAVIVDAVVSPSEVCPAGQSMVLLAGEAVSAWVPLSVGDGARIVVMVASVWAIGFLIRHAARFMTEQH